MTSNTQTDAVTGQASSSFAVMLRIAAALLALAVVSILVVRSSTAAFTDVTQNTGNAFVVGSVDLVDDDAASAMFNVTNMEPGQTAVDCIVVTYQGSVPDTSAVKLYSGGYTDSGTLATFLNLTVEEGTGGSFGDCTGFVTENTIVSSMALNTFDTNHTNYGNGAGVWDPSSTPVSKTYRVTVELDALTPNAQQGQSVTTFILNWETQN
jgi:hypothetical protein